MPYKRIFIILVLFSLILNGSPVIKISRIIQGTRTAVVRVGDINGNGQPDFLINCKDGSGNLFVKVFNHRGSQKLFINLGEKGLSSYIPWSLWDLDGDGKDEIIGVIKVSKGYELKVFYKPNGWKVAGIPVFNPTKSLRYLKLAFAKWNGKWFILYGYGHYIHQWRYVAAYKLIKNGQLWKVVQIWEWKLRPRQGKALAHGFMMVDLNRDGDDEVFQGAAVFNKHGFWKWWPGIEFHSDGVHAVGNYVYTHIESYSGGIKIHNRAGRLFWKKHKFCGIKSHHVHYGWMADVTAAFPGPEVWAGIKPRKYKCFPLFSSRGLYIGNYDFRLGPIEWDGDPQKELFYRGSIYKFYGRRLRRISSVRLKPGTVFAQDILGDRREEIINTTRENGWLTLYVFQNRKQVRIPDKPLRIDKKYLQKKRTVGH